MDKRTLKRLSVLKMEAKELLELVRLHEIYAETDKEKVEVGQALVLDIQELPNVGFSYEELYTILRFFVGLNSHDGEVAHYVQDKNETFLCEVLAAGIIDQVYEYAKESIEKTLTVVLQIGEGDELDAVQR
ncbi:MAG: hypothetical protein UDB11_03415 [Peptococcaceae bacterium]|nr:hypothetical protein [Peptococcaceae bacterium]